MNFEGTYFLIYSERHIFTQMQTYINLDSYTNTLVHIKPQLTVTHTYKISPTIYEQICNYLQKQSTKIIIFRKLGAQEMINTKELHNHRWRDLQKK